jgi:toxin ParE1/3/4
LSIVVYSPLAEDDLFDIWVSIASDHIQNADRFVEELHALAQELANQPLMGRARPEFGKDVRSFPHGDYLVIYRPMNDGVGIARVVYGGRDLAQVVVARE